MLVRKVIVSRPGFVHETLGMMHFQIHMLKRSSSERYGRGPSLMAEAFLAFNTLGLGVCVA